MAIVAIPVAPPLVSWIIEGFALTCKPGLAINFGRLSINFGLFSAYPEIFRRRRLNKNSAA